MFKGHEGRVQILRIFLEEVIRNLGESSIGGGKGVEARLKELLEQEVRYFRSQL